MSVAVEIGKRQAGRKRCGTSSYIADACSIRSVAVSELDADRAVPRIGGNEVGPAVTVRIKECNTYRAGPRGLVVEDGLASKTMAAYIDLNPIRAGMVADPAESLWTARDLRKEIE